MHEQIQLLISFQDRNNFTFYYLILLTAKKKCKLVECLRGHVIWDTYKFIDFIPQYLHKISFERKVNYMGMFFSGYNKKTWLQFKYRVKTLDFCKFIDKGYENA